MTYEKSSAIYIMLLLLFASQLNLQPTENEALHDH